MLREPGFKPKKRLGQNFLIHRNVIESILRLLDLQPQDQIVEIGPGLGFLTHRLVERAQKVWAIEVDNFLADRLSRSALGSHPGFQLIHDDVLKVNPERWLPPHKVKLVANLPYSISTPVLFRLFEWREHFSFLVLMLQKEVAQRIASAPGSKEYGALSVWSQIHGRVTGKFSVSPEAFYPRPKVKSTVVKLDLYPRACIGPDEVPLLRGVVRAAFGQRRKTLANALAAWLKRERHELENFLRAQKIDPGRRGETLSVEEFTRLVKALSSADAALSHA